MDLLVKWGRERISLPFPDPSTTLGELKHHLSEKTSLPVNQFKLVHAGAVMKDNNALLSAYGLKPGSKLTLIGTSAPLPTAREAASKPSIPRTQEGMLVIIKTELDNVHQKITPSLQTFLNSLSSDSSSPPAEPRMVNPSNEDLQQEHTRIGELLLQSLLRLDAITPESEWEEARKARKAAVKEVQADLDILDASWRAARTAVVANGSTSPSNGVATEGTGKSKSKKRR